MKTPVVSVRMGAGASISVTGLKKVDKRVNGNGRGLASKAFGAIERIMAEASDRNVLLETEVYEVFRLLGLSVPRHQFFPRAEANGRVKIDPGVIGKGRSAVVKIVSSVHLHKTEVKGVVMTDGRRASVETAIAGLRKRFPLAEGIMVVEAVEHARSRLGHELILGARHDPAFGPVLSLGPGGTGVEAFAESMKPGLVPSLAVVGPSGESAWAADLLDRSWIWKWLCGGIRGLDPLVAREEMERWVAGVGALMREFSDGGTRAWTIEELECNPLVVSGGRLVPLDGLLRFRASIPSAELPARPKEALERLINPKRVAVVGVGGERSVGRIILRNVIEGGYPKDQIVVVKPDHTEIDGVTCVPSLSLLADPVDSTVVSTPSSALAGLVKEAANGKTGGLVVISGGVGEKAGTESLEAEVAEVIRNARRDGQPLAVCGANSLGIWSRPAKFNTFFIPSHKMPPSTPSSRWTRGVGFVSQSGAFIISTMSRLGWLNPVYAVSAGNQLDVTLGEYVEFLAEDSKIEVIALYAEGIKDGDGLRMADAVKKARSRGKWVIVYKAGRTAAGAQAVRGHTASIAGEYPVFRMALEQAGALLVESFDDFDDALRLGAAWKPGMLGKGRTLVVTNAGFEAAGAADVIGRSPELTLPLLDSATQRVMEAALAKQGLEKIIDAKNPLDLTPIANDATYVEVLEAALTSREADAVVLSIVPMTSALQTLPEGSSHSENFKANSMVERIGEDARKSGKPVVACVSAGAMYDPYAAAIEAEGIPMFRNVDRAVRMISKFMTMENRPIS